MKTFISNEEFNQVLELLGLPGETISIEIRGRDRWVMTGVASSWALRAVIGDVPVVYDSAHNQTQPYQERVVYVPVLLPNDVLPAEAWPNTVPGQWIAPSEVIYELPENSKACASVPCPSFEEATLDVAKCPTCGRAELKWHFTQKFPCVDEFHNSGIVIEE